MLFLTYGRPVYLLNKVFSDFDLVHNAYNASNTALAAIASGGLAGYDDGGAGVGAGAGAYLLAYTGSRWGAMYYEGLNFTSLEYWINYASEFHSMWGGLTNHVRFLI